MQEKSRKKIVFVLGMHRSGTSLTAEIIHSMGFSVPGISLDSIDSVNAHGFWESKDVFEINEKILSAAGLKWYHICPVGHVFKNLSDMEGFSREISGFLALESEKLGDLVIKDPRICLLWPLWFSAIDQSVFNIKVIFVNRHPSSVAASIRKRDGFSFFSSHLLWTYYFFSVFGREKFPETLVLNYEQLLCDKHNGSVISDFIGGNPISKDLWVKMADSSLQRNFDIEFPSDSFIFGLESRIYKSILHGYVYKNFDFLNKENDEFEKFIFNSSDLVFALNESNNCIVESRSDLVFMGSMHSEALSVIKEKDFAIFESSAYIDSCHARISELDLSILELNTLPPRLEELENRLLLRNEDITRNTAYISECEGRIFDLEFSMSEFVALRTRLVEVESVLHQKESDVAHNAEYIAKAEFRISELEDALQEFDALRARLVEIESSLHEKEVDAARNADYIVKSGLRIAELEYALRDFDALRARLAEIESSLHEKEVDAAHNADYIAHCHARISELDDMFLQQRNNYLSALNTVSQFEQKLANRNAEFFSVMDDFSALKRRLEGLLSWRIVRMLERYSSKRVH